MYTFDASLVRELVFFIGSIITDGIRAVEEQEANRVAIIDAVREGDVDKLDELSEIVDNCINSEGDSFQNKLKIQEYRHALKVIAEENLKIEMEKGR